MSDQVWFDDVSVGDQLPPVLATPDSRRLFFFSAATANGHRIHYDRAWAVDVEHYEDILVQGPLQAALLARVVTDWIAPLGQLRRYSYEHRSSAVQGEHLRFGGIVTDRSTLPDGGQVHVELTAETEDGRLLVPGSAVVELPRRPERV